MKCVVLTWIGENRDIRRSPPAGRRALPVRTAGTCPPGDRTVPACARHTVRRMQVVAVAVASVAVHRIAVVEKPDAVQVWAVAVTATLSAADSAAHSAAVRSSVSAFAVEVDMTVSVAAALASAVAAPVPAVVVRNLP